MEVPSNLQGFLSFLPRMGHEDSFRPLHHDDRTRQLVKGEQEVPLSPKAFELLMTLAAKQPQALSKAELHQRLWPKTFVSEANLSNLVAEVRAALGDLRALPLVERKRRLRAALRGVESGVVYVDHIRADGRALFRETCRQDLEGIVGKWAAGSYQTGSRTSWLKFKNPRYCQAERRHELFESGRSRFEGHTRRAPTPVLEFR